MDTATVLPAPCWRRLSSVACLGALTPEVLRSVRQGVPIYPLAEGSWVVGSLLMPYYEHPRSVACRRCHGFFFSFLFSFLSSSLLLLLPLPPPVHYATLCIFHDFVNPIMSAKAESIAELVAHCKIQPARNPSHKGN